MHLYVSVFMKDLLSAPEASVYEMEVQDKGEASLLYIKEKGKTDGVAFAVREIMQLHSDPHDAAVAMLDMFDQADFDTAAPSKLITRMKKLSTSKFLGLVFPVIVKDTEIDDGVMYDQFSSDTYLGKDFPYVRKYVLLFDDVAVDLRHEYLKLKDAMYDVTEEEIRRHAKTQLLSKFGSIQLKKTDNAPEEFWWTEEIRNGNKKSQNKPLGVLALLSYPDLCKRIIGKKEGYILPVCRDYMVFVPKPDNYTQVEPISINLGTYLKDLQKAVSEDIITMREIFSYTYDDIGKILCIKDITPWIGRKKDL